jgi:hypothetical protein
MVVNGLSHWVFGEKVDDNALMDTQLKNSERFEVTPFTKDETGHMLQQYSRYRLIDRGKQCLKVYAYYSHKAELDSTLVAKAHFLTGGRGAELLDFCGSRSFL